MRDVEGGADEPARGTDYIIKFSNGREKRAATQKPTTVIFCHWVPLSVLSNLFTGGKGLASQTAKSNGSFFPVEMVNTSDQELAVGLHVSQKTSVCVLPDGLHENEQFKTNPQGQKMLMDRNSFYLMVDTMQQRVDGHPKDSDKFNTSR